MARAFRCYELPTSVNLPWCRPLLSSLIFFTMGSRLLRRRSELSWLRAVTLMSLKNWVPQEQPPAITVWS